MKLTWTRRPGERRWDGVGADGFYQAEARIEPCPLLGYRAWCHVWLIDHPCGRIVSARPTVAAAKAWARDAVRELAERDRQQARERGLEW